MTESIPRRWILALADDLTGALETGAKLARNGLAARVTTSVPQLMPPDVAVLVVDTETRHLPAPEAAHIVRETAKAAARFSPWLVFKKTDSALRGNIAAEFQALRDVFDSRELVYAPAYPEMGRTVKDGHLLVWGKPVHETAFANDFLNPVRESKIHRVLGHLPVEILDGESNDDLRNAAQRVLNAETPPLAAGPAAFAEALGERLGCAARPYHWPKISRALVVNGSLHPASKNQIMFAQEHGIFDEGWLYLDSGGTSSGLKRAWETGECVRRRIETSPVDALVAFGGDTVFGIHRALGSSDFEPHGELVPGVPLSSCGGLLWITKAGGFGQPDILYEIRKRLT